MVFVISGSRDYPDLEKVRHTIMGSLMKGDTLFHGGARGVDRVAGFQAMQQGVDIRVRFPNWEKHGKAAGVIRNSTMLAEAIEYAREKKHHLQGLVFWDGQSKGTKHMIDLMTLHEVEHTVIGP